MESKRTVCLRRLGEGRAEEVRFGRFLANDKVTSVSLAETLCAATAPVQRVGMCCSLKTPPKSTIKRMQGG